MLGGANRGAGETYVSEKEMVARVAGDPVDRPNNSVVG
jgi:hypothetical protein